MRINPLERMIKCRRDRFWVENILIDGITNWIQTKYLEYPNVRLIGQTNILIKFIGKDSDLYDRIIQDIAENFDLKPLYIRKGCEKKYGDAKSANFYSYELTKSEVKNEKH